MKRTPTRAYHELADAMVDRGRRPPMSRPASPRNQGLKIRQHADLCRWMLFSKLFFVRCCFLFGILTLWKKNTCKEINFFPPCLVKKKKLSLLTMTAGSFARSILHHHYNFSNRSVRFQLSVGLGNLFQREYFGHHGTYR